MNLYFGTFGSYIPFSFFGWRYGRFLLEFIYIYIYIFKFCSINCMPYSIYAHVILPDLVMNKLCMFPWQRILICVVTTTLFKSSI